MAKRVDQKGRSKESERYIAIPYWVLNSLAFRSLAPVSKALLIELKRRFNGSNNGLIHLSVREAGAALNIAPNTASWGLRELEAKGFIRVKFKGTFKLKSRYASGQHAPVCRATEWELTEYACDNNLPTKDFMKLDSAQLERIEQELKSKRAGKN